MHEKSANGTTLRAGNHFGGNWGNRGPEGATIGRAEGAAYIDIRGRAPEKSTPNFLPPKYFEQHLGVRSLGGGRVNHSAETFLNGPREFGRGAT